MASTNTKAAAEVQEKKFDWHQIKSLLPIISFVAIVAIFAILTRGQLITPRNITLIISGGFTLMIATVGVYMIMSMGCLDFSQGSILGLSAISLLMNLPFLLRGWVFDLDFLALDAMLAPFFVDFLLGSCLYSSYHVGVPEVSGLAIFTSPR